jgi:signal transduction histidine kinase
MASRTLDQTRRWAFPILAGGLLLIVTVAFMVAALIGAALDNRAAMARLGADGDAVATRMLALFAELSRMVMVTAESPIVQGRDLPPLANHLLAIAASDPRIDQARLIAPNGWEEVRVNNDPNGPRLVPKADLQDKTARPYVQDTLGFPRGALRISPLDLNIEHGRVDYPLVPTIRLSTPVFTPSGTLRGMVVFNINAEVPLTQMSQRARRSGERILLHVAGSHWIIPDSGGESGWRLVDGDTAGDLFPEARAAVARDLVGTWRSQDALWHHQTLDLRATLPLNRLVTAVGGFPELHVLTTVPTKPVVAKLRETAPQAVIAAALALAIAWYWSRALVGQARARDARERAVQRLARSEKLASLGGMVAGIAHELNTPIGNALTIASTIDERAREVARTTAANAPPMEELTAFLDDMAHGARALVNSLERATTLVRRFKAVAVDQTGEKRRAFALDPFLEDLLATMRPRFKTRPITLTLDLQARMVLDSFPGALGQAVMNLVDNALTHAFPEGEGGEIRVAAEALSDDWARVTCSDTGRGVAPQHLPRLFEPFYTTRASLGGGGLGLAIVHGTVTNFLGGQIHVRSTPGLGTSFTIDLPKQAPGPPSASQQENGHADGP